MHDPAVYHDPMVFKPERFLGIDGREPELDPHDLALELGVASVPRVSWQITHCI
jgi:hypothetical protein